MTKKHFIALADLIKQTDYLPNGVPKQERVYSLEVLEGLADFCQSINPRFNRERWLGYIKGTCGPNGGKV